MQLAQDEYWNQYMSHQQQFMRNQKKAIMQSSIDRNRYNRAGDDACTSGVSMSSSDKKFDSESLKSSRFGTLQENSKSIVKPLTNSSQFVWYASYDSEMKDSVFGEILDQWENKANPISKICIKLEDYDVVFAKLNQVQSMVYLKHHPFGSCFIKLYLIEKDQLIEIAINKNRMFCPEFTNFSSLRTSLIDNQDSTIINPSLPYGYFLRIGEYDGFSIYWMTNSTIQNIREIKSSWNPSDFYIKELFQAMTESFSNFSQDFLLYYLNSRKGLYTKLSKELISQLREYGTLRDM